MENKTMKIQVLGSGCSSCKKLFELTKKAAEELKLKRKWNISPTFKKSLKWA